MLKKVTLVLVTLSVSSCTDLLATDHIGSSHLNADKKRTRHFFSDAKVSGKIYNMTRIRDRRDDVSNSFKENLYLSSSLANVDFSSGLLDHLFGVGAGVFGTLDMWHSGTSQYGEIALIDDRERIKNGFSFYKAAVRVEHSCFKAHAGYIQPSGPGVLGVNLSFVPGTYRGGEAAFHYEGLIVALMWADQYKKPWIYDMKTLLRKDGTALNSVYSVGAHYDLGNGVSVMGGFGQGEDFIDLYKFKLAYSGHLLAVSYQLYAMNDKNDGGIVWNADHTKNTTNDIFEGLAYQHVLMSNIHLHRWTFRAEASYTNVKGSESNFAFRPTGYNGGSGGSNGAYEVWWDSRSDFNHNGEKAVFFGGWYHFKHGWSAGLSYAFGWDGKPNTLNPAVTSSKKLREQAYNADISYIFQSGHLKGTSITLHCTLFNNKTGLPSSSRAFPGAFKDEKDIKLIFSMPWL
ncbi:hypothetical protein GZ77_21795 [Endozoicomonas montiporae]|uniref:Porin n=2 Tax=Endozoicomonas montiporae TaxID=1027273 RepID=A0A081N3M1_9GAMM|nr:OprD family outer membrane porin [Endozoicomonas montiporae]AMO58358.1 hypothetical protein EZMO1_4442 [Endozoicomonas montiporae CL-33]KEQ13044.1 hypothetical protein GZ77_21795 [Endozoicomonas montiporae]